MRLKHVHVSVWLLLPFLPPRFPSANRHEEWTVGYEKPGKKT